jgi:hypothetical protein
MNFSQISNSADQECIPSQEVHMGTGYYSQVEVKFHQPKVKMLKEVDFGV